MCKKARSGSISLLLCVNVAAYIVLICGAPSDESETILDQPDPPNAAPTQRRILVFGGNGFLGAETVELFINNGDNVTIVNRGNWYWDSYHRIRPYVDHISCDRDNGVSSCKDLVDLIYNTEQFDAVIDFSSYGPNATADAIHVLNGKAKLYVLISTDSIYDVCIKDDLEIASKETDAQRPEGEGAQETLAFNHDYAHRKLQSEEELVKQRDAERGVPYVILRLPDVIGPRDTTHRWWLYQLWIKLESRMQSKPVSIPSFLVDYKMSFVYSLDVAKLVFDLISRAPSDVQDQVFNVAYPETFQVDDVIEKIRQDLDIPNNKVEVEKNQSLTLFVYPSVRKGPIDVSKIQDKLDWKPTSWDTAVKDTVGFFEEAMKEDKFSTQRDEIIQIFTHHLYETEKDKVYSSLEDAYGINLHHFRPRDEL